jgi:4-methyl-5(b-hydroxyethyl)-thiazole monophosphate biosynthesis
VVDVLRRAHMHVDVASVESDGAAPVVCARGLRLLPDMSMADARPQRYDLIALPGGMPGAASLAASAPLVAALREARADGRWVAAICAAPAVVLAATPGLVPRAATLTCHAAFVEQLARTATFAGAAPRVCVDHAHKIVTSRGPGTALEWALALVDVLGGAALAAEVAKPMHAHGEDVQAALSA